MVVTYNDTASLRGKGTVSAAAIDAWFRSVNKDAPAELGAAIVAECIAAGMNADLVAAQVALESDYYRSAIATQKLNPAGIGAENSDPFGLAIAFPTVAAGIHAQVEHLLTYVLGDGPWGTDDPRFDAVKAAGWLGSVKVLRDLNGRWAFPGTTYGADIAAWANALVDFAEHGVWNVGPDISGYVPPKIVQQWFPVNGVSYMGEAMQMQGVCVHQTGNTSAGAEAQQNVDYMNSQECIQRQASWHATIGLHTIIETIPQTKQSYHASDGSGPGNTHFKAVEHVVCYPVGSAEYRQVMQNGAWYTAKSLRDAGLPCNADTVKQHHDFARDGKSCPQQFRDNGQWPEYMAYVKAFYDQMGGGAVPAQPADNRIMVEGNPLGKFGYQSGFRARLEAIGEAISPNDVTAGILTIAGWAQEDEYPGVDGCAYQRCERGTLQWTPNTAAPFDIVMRRCGDALPVRKL